MSPEDSNLASYLVLNKTNHRIFSKDPELEELLKSEKLSRRHKSKILTVGATSIDYCEPESSLVGESLSHNPPISCERFHNFNYKNWKKHHRSTSLLSAWVRNFNFWNDFCLS